MPIYLCGGTVLKQCLGEALAPRDQISDGIDVGRNPDGDPHDSAQSDDAAGYCVHPIHGDPARQSASQSLSNDRLEFKQSFKFSRKLNL
jgi:hypothetical protein